MASALVSALAVVTFAPPSASRRVDSVVDPAASLLRTRQQFFTEHDVQRGGELCSQKAKTDGDESHSVASFKTGSHSDAGHADSSREHRSQGAALIAAANVDGSSTCDGHHGLAQKDSSREYRSQGAAPLAKAGDASREFDHHIADEFTQAPQ